MTQGNISLSIVNQENQLVDASKIRDISKQIDELDKAIQKTKDAEKLASRVKEKGFFSMLGGTFDGSNTKDLAESVKILGGSVEITQKIIQVILEISNEKNQVLKGFSQALTDKILSLSEEMELTHGNQKNAKQATIIIATQLRAQIEEKIKQSEMIDQHEVEISQLHEFVRTKDTLDEEQSAAILNLKEKIKIKDDLDHNQSQEIYSIKNIIEQNENIDQKQSKDIQILKEISISKEMLDNQQSDDIIKLKDNFTKINSSYEIQSQKIYVLTEKNEALQKAIELTTSNFNEYVALCNSSAYKLKIIALPLISIFIASVALYFSFK